MLISFLLGLALMQSQGAPRLPDQNPLELSLEMRSYLDQKLDRKLPEMERLQALNSLLFQENALGFAYAPETRTVIETFTSRSGNCLSFTLLFIAMARYLGLDARFREVEIAPVWSKNGMFASLNKHVNAAVFLGGLGYVIDVFPGVNRIEVGGQVVEDARGLAHFYNNKGADQLGAGNLAVAEPYLRKALEIDPKAGCAWINLGVLKIQAGQFQEAERYCKKALEIDPREPVAMTNLAVVYERMGRVREAARYLAKVRKFNEKNPYHHHNLGLQAFEAGQYQESITHYKRALKLKPMEHHFYFAMARACAKLSQLNEVMNNLQLAIKYSPDPSNKLRYSEKLDLLKGSSRGVRNP